jgi:biotin-dependent carboxylase-like uncharacterized protein
VTLGLTIESGGFLTTVQDRGRPGHAAIGVSACGAADPIALEIGNRLVGNDASAAALEMTLVGATVRFQQPAVVALTGAEASAAVDGRRVPEWSAFDVEAGQTVACGALRGGCRAYLCVRGGLAVPPVLGSASTHLTTGLGGMDGRALRAGDRIVFGSSAAHPPCRRVLDPRAVDGYRPGDPFDVTEGVQASWFTREARETFATATWRVAEACDRMGIRLEGPELALAAPRELVTEGVGLGAIQVPADGRPIVLFVDHQTTGGYPKIANVVGSCAARLGQLRPRDTLRFAWVDFDDAVRRVRAQGAALAALLR